MGDALLEKLMLNRKRKGLSEKQDQPSVLMRKSSESSRSDCSLRVGPATLMLLIATHAQLAG